MKSSQKHCALHAYRALKLWIVVCTDFYVEAVHIERPGTVCKRKCNRMVPCLLLLMTPLRESVEF
jgi:hypothetical protein